MIRKVCVLLVVLLAAMLGLKVALVVCAGKPSQATSAENGAHAANAVAELAPTVYYTRWIPYAVENDVSRRNGYLLDLVRAIFPKARFVRVFGETKDVVAALERDPNGVSVIYGDHPDFANFQKATTPILELDMVVYTMRTNNWRFAGDMESLTHLRLGFVEDYLDVKDLREYAKRHPDRVRIYEVDEPGYDNLAGEVLAGRIDGFAVSKANANDARQIGMAAERLIELRMSKTITTGAALFIPSNKDAAQATRFIEAYEKGRKKIEKSGELRRIREYYNIPPPVR